MKIKLRKQPGHNKSYVSYVVTIPKEIIRKVPRFKKQKFVEIDTDVMGNIVIKAEKSFI